ncbi:MAG: CvpA family protein [Chitinophagales bacterium]|jgi:membrane protein required for colicin V production|nr:CvpA family protein [Chitinophagales bacterium]
MIFDIVFLIFIAVAFWWGYTKGIIYSVFSFIGYFIAIAAAVKFSYIAMSYLKELTNLSGKSLSILAFVTVFVLIVIIVRLLAWILEQILKSFSLNFINQFAGGVVHSIVGIYVLCVLVWFGNKWDLISVAQRSTSHVYSYIANFAPSVMEYSGKVVPALKDTFSKYEALLKEDNTQHEDTAH